MNLDTQIYNLARKNGFTDASARNVVAQARLESADYTSNVFKLNNNMFGMKFLGTSKQPLAVRGSMAPRSERTASCLADPTKCSNINFYAKFSAPIQSAQDVIERLYKITMGGVTPDMLKNANDPVIYANLLKKRGYYGSSASGYASGLKAKLKKLDIVIGTGIIKPLSLLLPIFFFLMYKLAKKR
jgi:hypothetical protein